MAKPACHTVGILVGVGMEVTLERGLVGDIMLGGGGEIPSPSYLQGLAPVELSKRHLLFSNLIFSNFT